MAKRDYSYLGMILNELYKIEIHPRIHQWYYTINAAEFVDGMDRHVEEPPVKVTNMASGEVSYVRRRDVESSRNNNWIKITFPVRVPSEMPGLYASTSFEFHWSMDSAVRMFINNYIMPVVSSYEGETVINLRLVAPQEVE